MVFSLRKTEIGGSRMGLTYAQKPAFVDRMIETGSQAFLLGMSKLFQFSASVEAGEHISQIEDTAGALPQAVWHLEKASAIYKDLIGDLKSLEASPQINTVVENMNFVDLKSSVIGPTAFIEINSIWDSIIDNVRGANPVGGLSVFVDLLLEALAKVKELLDSIEGETLDMWKLHAALAACTKALIAGQYIAAINRYSREKFA
jgi:hypothetical protein